MGGDASLVEFYDKGVRFASGGMAAVPTGLSTTNLFSDELFGKDTTVSVNVTFLDKNLRDANYGDKLLEPTAAKLKAEPYLAMQDLFPSFYYGNNRELWSKHKGCCGSLWKLISCS